MRKQTNYNQLVGRIGNEYYFCDYIFEQDTDFKGATATVLSPVPKETYDDIMDPESDAAKDRFEELWVESVKSGTTELGLLDYIAELNYTADDCFDPSGYDLWDSLREAVPSLTEDDFPVFECIGGGRSFRPDMEWDEIYNPELWAKIKAVETK